MSEKKKLPERSTRGKRLTELIEEEIEVDKKFYSEVFEDEENEEEKAEFEVGEEEEEDAVDSDFDLEEDLTVITPQVDTKESSTPKKNVYKDPLKSGKKKTTVASSVTTPSTKSTPKRKRIEKDETKLRKSNRSNTVQASERLQHKLSIEAPTQTRKKRKTEHKALTQEDMLREAAKTAQINTKSLENLIQIEEEKKKVPKNLKVQIEGPMIRLLSRNGVETITFTSEIPTFIHEKEDENRKSRGLCIVSGIEAKYVDPVTGVSYATVNAFKTIRECFEQFKLLFGDHATSPSYNDKMFLVNFHYFFHQRISSMTEMKEEEWKY
jgi:vacuolar protein sorting-associated protein 72